MEDINKLWQSLKDDNNLPPIDEKQLLLQSNSLNTLKKLKTNFKINIAFALAITFGFIVLFFYIDGFWVRFFIGLLLTGYFAAIFQTIYLYRKYLFESLPDENVYQYLKSLHNSISKALKAQEYSALVYYPIAAIAGFLIPIYMSGNMDAFQKDVFIWYVLIALIIILTPICFLLAKWMNKIAFGNYLKQIKKLIDAMEEEN
jgi:hypothetical protein